MFYQLKQSIKLFDSLFFTLLSLSILYPFFSFCEPLSTSISFSITSLCVIHLFFKKNNTAIIKTLLIIIPFITLAFNFNFYDFQQKGFIILSTQISLFYLSSTIVKSNIKKYLLISLIFGLMMICSIYGLLQKYYLFDFLIQNLNGDQLLFNRDLSIKILKNKNIMAQFPNSNLFSSFLLISIVLLCLKIKHSLSSKCSKIILLLLLCPVSLIFFGPCKSSKFLTLITFSLFFFKQHRNKLFLFLTTAAFLLITSLSPFVFNQFSKLHDSVKSRIQYIETSYKIIQKSPLIGHGLETFEKLAPSHSQFQDEVTQYVHHSFLDKACDIGLLSSFLLFAYFIWIIITSLKSRHFINKDSQQADMSVKRHLLFLIPLSIILFTMIHFPPFAFLDYEYSLIISFILIFLCFLFAHYFFTQSKFLINHMNTIFIFSSFLLLLQSFVEINLDKVQTSYLFFIFIGSLSHNIQLKSPKLSKFLLPLFFLFSLYFLSSKIISLKINAYFDQKLKKHPEQSLQAVDQFKIFTQYNSELQFKKNTYLLINSIVNHNEKQYLKNINIIYDLINQSQSYYYYFKTSKILFQYSHTDTNKTLLLKDALKFIHLALEYYPHQQKCHFLKAQILERSGSQAKAHEIYKKLLSDYKKRTHFNYANLLNQEQVEYIKQIIN